MSMSTHTPGPWVWWTSNSWRRLKSDRAGCRITVLEPFVCRDGHPDVSVDDCDMRLIAAAPDMHAALSDLAQVFLARPDILGLCGPHEHALIREACDALNKAAGAAP